MSDGAGPSGPSPEEEQAFLRRFPEYSPSTRVEGLRATEFARLDRLGHVYVDYTGGGLFAESQVRKHAELYQSAEAWILSSR